MLFKKWMRLLSGTNPPSPVIRQIHAVPPVLDTIREQFKDCSDLTEREFPELEITLFYFKHMVSPDLFEREVLTPLENIQADETDELLKNSIFIRVTEEKLLIEKIVSGWAALFVKGTAYTVDIYGPEVRAIEQSETEGVIVGPHDAFTESLEANLSLIRRRVKSNRLKVQTLTVGEVTKSKVFVLYIDGIANMEYVNTMTQRIQAIETDAIFDATMLVQLIDDFPNSVFPVMLNTERPDVAASKLVEGKVVAIVEQSPSVICGPTSFFEFFISPDDYYSRWAVGTATRLLRYTAFIITISFTALYVSVTTYHYEMIPDNLITTLTESRSRVPFPPVFEALLMETTIELLREAGARLPTKIGQTIGIVGGIVIGQAAVQAGFTSNILIIAVASSAIASYVIPSYTMSASIRLIRFGLVIAAGVLGNFGLMAGIALVIIHLAKLTSLGAPYTMPVAPIKLKDWKDIFIRAPFWSLKSRPAQSLSINKKYNKLKK
ncbi:spore germination protein [Paenibacillus chitinolyticus]|uniref:spore germination protein n=1 Tax=Paenibacillus chitinolyticus TaxID=79263 RepID=UPI002DB61E12|nr:spore germination protein [Paenibacillus chitinolyticus]MEC0244436.1 spore germination protein [Paenibacillus chitinolyticus]